MNSEFWTNRRGEAFHFVHWKGSEYSNRTLMLIHHGHGEHAKRYDGFSEQLSDLPVDVRGFDCRGHGESCGVRGRADGLDGLVADLEEIIPVMLEKSGADRLILFGHSMGGAVIAHYLTAYEPHPAVVGAILSAPALAIPRTFSTTIKVLVARALDRVLPHLILDTELDAAGISSVPEEVERYKRDPLIHSKISIRLGKSLIDDGALAAERSGRVSVPLLVYHGGDDPIVSIEGSQKFATNAVNAEVEYLEFAGCFHESHHESPKDAAQVFNSIRRWVSALDEKWKSKSLLPGCGKSPRF